jgi:hypothetical protein
MGMAGGMSSVIRRELKTIPDEFAASCPVTHDYRCGTLANIVICRDENFIPPSGAMTGRAALPAEIMLFDFISHETMHLPFNESYIRTLRAAFPADLIIFHARAGHVANLAPRVADLDKVVLRPCLPFTVPFGLSRHNPLGAWLAARRCHDTMRRAIAKAAAPRLAVLLGIDSSLYAVVGRGWPRLSNAPLHMILHGQLGDNMVWRSRNPVARAFDLISAVRRPLPPSVRLVALELGVKAAIAEIAPANDSIITLEHPILPGESNEDSPPGVDRLKIAFVGNARRSKGFEVFAKLARKTKRSDLEFQAIGVAAPDTDHLDTTAMTRKPSREPLSRQDYLEGVRAADIVCLPLHSRAYDFTASGTVSDAVSALKPLLAFRNKTLDAIVAKYGSIGWLVDSEAELFSQVETMKREDFLAARSEWVANLRKIRDARRPEALAPGYAALIEASHGH